MTGKQTVRRLITEVINGGDLDLIGELYEPDAAAGARAWIGSFRDAFPDVRMDIAELVAEGDTVVGRFTCSGTHTGTWRGHSPTGRRFTGVDEVVFYRLRGGQITDTWTLEDTPARLRQLGLDG